MINLQWIRLRSPTQYKCMLHRKYIDHARCGWLRNDECIGNTCNTGGGSIFKYSCTLELNNEVFFDGFSWAYTLYIYMQIVRYIIRDIDFLPWCFKKHLFNMFTQNCLHPSFRYTKKKNPQLKLSIHAITYFSLRYRNICLFVLYLAFINNFPVFSANIK